MIYNLPPEAQKLINDTQLQLYRITGKKIKLHVFMNKTPYDMLVVIAESLGMRFIDYRKANRSKEYIHLRMAGVLMMDIVFPKVHTVVIGNYYACDHTTISNTRRSGRNMIETNDDLFMPIYKTALEAVEKWLQD